MTKINAIAAFCARALTSTIANDNSFSHAALTDMTDAQLRRTGMSKAGIVHHTFSGLYYA